MGNAKNQDNKLKNATLNPTNNKAEPVIAVASNQSYANKAGAISYNVPRNFPILLKTTTESDKDYSLLHWQNEVDLMYVVEGKQIEINLVTHTYTFDAPAILMIPGSQVHSISCSNHTVIQHVLFDPMVLLLQRFDEAQSNLILPLSEGMIAPFEPIRVGEPGFEQLTNLLTFLTRFASSYEAGVRLQVKGCLTQVLGVLYQFGYLNKKPLRRVVNRNTRDDKIKDLLDYINANYNHPLSIVDAAKRMDLSKQYFCRFFKELTGMSFVDYLNVIRLKKIANDILTTKEGINDIATRHGFDSISHFFKLFKLHFGCTPNQYRQSKGQAANEEKLNSN